MCASFAQADLFDHYGGHFRQVPRPIAAPGSFGVAVDAMPDGRLVLATGREILIESSPGAGAYALAATIQDSVLAEPMDPGFLVVSPSGERIALGAGFGKPVIIVNRALLDTAQPALLTSSNTIYFDVDHFAASWLDESHLALSAGDFGEPSVVTLLDLTSDPASPLNPIVITNIGGASAGVAIDSDGAIYTGNGFDLTPGAPGTSDTGWIKRFTTDEWMSVADFETDGQLIGDVLSASSLEFDRDGALIVGGGDFDEGDTGTLAVIASAALIDAISSGRPIDPGNSSHVKRLDPIGNGAGFFGAAFNSGTDEIIITDSSGWFATSGRRPGDLDGNESVNAADLRTLLGAYGTDSVFADLNQDGMVNGVDVATLLANWSEVSP